MGIILERTRRPCQRSAMKRLICLFILIATPVLADPATFAFSWKGAGGYKVRGAFTYDPVTVPDGIVQGHDLICFEMFGTHNGASIGTWALDQLTPDTPWIFTFDALNERLLVPGDAGISMPQAWNMGGRGDDCGVGGFGLNLGSAFQDVCINNTLIFDSQIDPFTPFWSGKADGYAYTLMDCQTVQLFSLLQEPM